MTSINDEASLWSSTISTQSMASPDNKAKMHSSMIEQNKGDFERRKPQFRETVCANSLHAKSGGKLTMTKYRNSLDNNTVINSKHL